MSRIFQTMIFLIQEDVIHPFDLAHVSGNFTNYVSVSVTPTGLHVLTCISATITSHHSRSKTVLKLSLPGATLSLISFCHHQSSSSSPSSSSHPPRCDTITDPLKKIELFKALASPAFIGNSDWILIQIDLALTLIAIKNMTAGLNHFFDTFSSAPFIESFSAI